MRGAPRRRCPAKPSLPADGAAPDAGELVRRRGVTDDPRAVRERRDRRRLGAPVAVAAAATLASVGAALAVAAAGPTAPHAAPSDDRAAVAAGRQFLARYVAADGRVAPRGDGAGQAHAMLIAAALRDEAAFRRVWRWTRTHLRQPDGLLASRWAEGRVVDGEPDADADLGVARALLVAAGAFHRPDHARAATRIGTRSAARRRSAPSAAARCSPPAPLPRAGASSRRGRSRRAPPACCGVRPATGAIGASPGACG